MRCALTNTPDAKYFLPKDFEIFKQTKGYIIRVLLRQQGSMKIILGVGKNTDDFI